MKLTPEQQAALDAAVSAGMDAESGPHPTARYEEVIFLAGCRYQHAVTLERAAKVCGDAEDKWAMPCGYINEYEQGRVNMAIELAAAIRALPYEDE